jgi:perosamine synthetase
VKYPLFKVHIRSKEALAEIKKVLKSGFINEGEQVTEFQELLKQYLGVENLVLLNSCTSALTIAYKLCGVGPGSEVITPAMTCVATNTPIINLGGKIIWADINSRTGSINPEDVLRKVTDKTKAIVYVNWGGTPAEIERIYEIGKQKNIPVIQDAAHSFGATWLNQPISDFADYTCYSFQAIKHLSSGDGGALVVKNSNNFKLARKLKWFGYDRDEAKDEKGEWKGQRWSADIEIGEVGFKFNMNNVSAAIGISQMKYIDEILAQHRKNASIYHKFFANSGIIKNLDVPKEADSSYWVYTCLVQTNSQVRDELLENLNHEGIGAGLVHLPNDIYSAFKEFKVELPETRKFESMQISLPCGWWLKEVEVEKIAFKTLDLLKILIK